MDIFASFLDQAPYLALFLMLLSGGIGLPVPEDATLILAGFLAAQETVKPLPALAVIYPGLLIADTLLYTFGRRFGRAVLERKRFRRLLPARKFAELETKFNRSGPSLILFGRHLAGLRVQLFLAAGILRMPYGKFLLADALSSLFTIGVMTGIGYLGGNSLQVIRKDVSRIEHVVVVVALVVVTGYLLVRYYRGQRKSGRTQDRV